MTLTHPQPMDRRAEIRDLASNVGHGLTAYIEVHDAIFRDASAFRSVLKNLFGRGVPMSKLVEDAEGLRPLWSTIHQKMESFRTASYSALSKDERRYFDMLGRYVDAVSRTVTALIERQRLLNEGSKGGAKNPMTWKAFQQKERAYQTAVKEYMAIGQELNDAAPVIFG